MAERKPGFDTLALHAGQAPDPATGARITPIYQTTAYVFDDVKHAADLFALRAFGMLGAKPTPMKMRASRLRRLPCWSTRLDERTIR